MSLILSCCITISKTHENRRRILLCTCFFVIIVKRISRKKLIFFYITTCVDIFIYPFQIPMCVNHTKEIIKVKKHNKHMNDRVTTSSVLTFSLFRTDLRLVMCIRNFSLVLVIRDSSSLTSVGECRRSVRFNFGS